LLIISDGEDVRDLLPEDQRIGLVHLASQETIGRKRNYGCSRAAGNVIAHWDDDDWSHPTRLSDQVVRLASSGKAVTGYNTMRFTDGVSSWRYRRLTSEPFAIGTSLCYRREFWAAHQFPAVQVGEDGVFVTNAAALKQLISVPAVTPDGTELMWATVHQDNTSPRRLSGANWEQVESR